MTLLLMIAAMVAMPAAVLCSVVQSGQILNFNFTVDLDVPPTFNTPIKLAFCNTTNMDTSQFPAALLHGKHSYAALVKPKVHDFGGMMMAIYTFAVNCQFVGPQRHDVFVAGASGTCVSSVSTLSDLQCIMGTCAAHSPASWGGLTWSDESKCPGASLLFSILGE